MAARYVMPFREGGSLPALVEGDDGKLYVVKLRGAGQGTRALVAELIAGLCAHALDLPVPELVLVELSAVLGRAEPDAEVRDVLLASAGVNVALAYLPSALAFDPAPAARVVIPGALASLIVALDAFTMNVDRTARNPNLLWSGGQLWLIDHGAAFYWHHDWDGGVAGAARPFPLIRDHVLLPWADALASAGETLRARLDDATIARVLSFIPDDWFVATPELPTPAAQRAAYAAFLGARRAATNVFIEEAVRARAARV
ncbi:MAG TPA: HipA family kinase [Polyangia bacterium]|jgi:hypothetical protein|nr:HipA family kinase [Polyangia bacterium]